MGDQLLKLLLVGDSGVGKSSLLSRFTENKFSEAFYNTIGVDFKTANLTIDNRKCRLQIWDTAGQERFRTITANYYRGADGILIVFDLTSNQSLIDVEFWLSEIAKNSVQGVPKILIGNKCDLNAKRQVSEEQAMAFAKKHKIDYIESSASSALNVKLVFESISRKIIQSKGITDKGTKMPQNKAKLNQSKQNIKAGCC